MNDRVPSPRTGATTPAFAPVIGLRDVLSAAPDLVFCCDAHGRFVWVSAAFELLAGYRPSDLVGSAFAHLVPESGRPGVLRHFARQARRGSPFTERTMSILRRDGSSVQVSVRVRLYDHVGERYWVGVARECESWEAPPRRVGNPEAPDASAELIELRSELVRAQLSLAEAQAALTAAERARSEAATEAAVARQERDEARTQARTKAEFLATMSHEVRTPLTGMLGMAGMLAQGPLGLEQRRMVELLQQSAQSLLTLVNDTTDFSRLDAGRMAIEQIDFDLRRAVDQVAALMQPLAAEKSLRLEARVEALVPSMLKGDPGRLRQVLLNLCGNAVKFTDAGAVQLTVERMREDDRHVALLFRIEDTGIGMSPEEQGRLFEPFVQADPSIARRFGGSGLGLAISRGLVELMGGSLGFESEAGRGSTFWFQVSFEKQGEVSAPAPRDVDLNGLRLLIAHPSPSVRRLMCDVSQAWGCESAEVETGMEALDAVREAAVNGRPYHVAVVSMQLPGLDGEDLGRAIRADRELDATLLMLTTAQGRPGDAQRARALGYSAYLLEPLEVSQFYDAIAEVTGRGHEAASPQERPLVTRHSLAESRRGRLRILLVEDDLVNQLVTKSALGRVGYHVEVAGSGREAIERTTTERWDLILMDMQMPGLDGCSATSAIRARERGAWRTPILGLTGHSTHAAHRERCLAAGMDDVFGKPVDLAELTTAVERWTLQGEARSEVLPALGDPPISIVVNPTSGPLALVEPPAAEEHAAAVAPPLPVLPEGPAIDVEQLNVASMGLPALRSSLLHTYLSDVYPRLDRLQHAVESGDAARVEFEAHGLSGMCATIGATGCTTLFGDLEQRARDGQLANARELVSAGRAEVARTEVFIERFERMISREAA
ncbi:MAG: response regulator [Candidatus Eisenbacteria bacterium]